MQSTHPDLDGLLAEGPILLYDGECGVCAASVQWIMSHERTSDLRFAAQQSDLGARLRRAGGLTDDVDSLIWVERSGAAKPPAGVQTSHHPRTVEVAIWSDAVLRVLSYVGGPWKILLLLRWLPRFIRHGAYRLFARHRTRFAPVSCLLPLPEQRARFLGS